MIIWIYRILFLPALLLSCPYYLKRMFKRGGYADGFKQRFGLLPEIPQKKKKRYWIQAVSVGEVRAIDPLIKALLKDGNEIVLTTTTSTGFEIAQKAYADSLIHVGIFPLDFVICSKLSWARIDPDVVILMEAELWPEHCRQAKKRNVPVYLINARLSDRSFARYMKVQSGAEWLLSFVDRVLASSEQDAERFKKLGADPDSVSVSGNLKIDVEVTPLLNNDERSKLTSEFGFGNSDNKPVILLGSSTWPGEEATLLLAYEAAKEAGINCRLLLVPRHAERRNEIKALLESQDDSWHFRSTHKQAPANTQIYVADTTGELTRITQCADLVYVGKSLPPNSGGQTPVEPAALERAIIYGPKMSNFRHICQTLEAANGAVRAKDSIAVITLILSLLQDEDRRKELSGNAKKWHNANRGAIQRILNSI